MKKMIITIAITIIVTILVLFLSINQIVSSAIEDYGSEMTGTSVTVERVAVSPFSGSGKVYGLTVENPEGFEYENALSIDELSLTIDLFTLFSNEVYVHEVTISGLTLFAEQNVPDNNIYSILSHMDGVAESETSTKHLIIEKFVLEDGTVELTSNVGEQRNSSLSVSRVELTDVGRGGVQEDVYQTIEYIAQEIAQNALSDIAGSGLEQLQNAIRGIFN